MSPQALDLQGRRALVTGGGKGIGRAISIQLAAMGAEVVVVYRGDAESAEATAAEIGGTAVRCDVSQDAEVQSMLGAAGRIDVLVNNAGTVRDNLVLRMKPQDWDEVIRTDLSSAFHTTRAVLTGMMRQRWGRIVNISSVVGITGNAGQANYAAAKAGLIGFTRSVAKEMGSRNVTVNAVAPGYVRTELTRASLSEEMMAGIIAATPLRREGTAEDVAAAVGFLCSAGGAFITGHTLVVDGGLSL
ncbi:MAG TPA: 3-oxoacyl-ACP reductase FabG [Candidatus Nitrosotalea sp.]|nr:3-oxoacyl-ACP reductase FabG [Candidatus Nitrosotalea sp.]